MIVTCACVLLRPNIYGIFSNFSEMIIIVCVSVFRMFEIRCSENYFKFSEIFTIEICHAVYYPMFEYAVYVANASPYTLSSCEFFVPIVNSQNFVSVVFSTVRKNA